MATGKSAADVELPEYPLDVQHSQQIIKRAIGASDAKLGADVADYMIMQFNPDTFKGFVKHGMLEPILCNATMGLCEKIYMAHWDLPLDVKDACFFSSFNAMAMLMTRIYEGKDYMKSIREAEAKIAYSAPVRRTDGV